MLDRANHIYRSIEKSYPAAGYRLHLVNPASRANSLEANFLAYGERPLDSLVELSEGKPDCAFCTMVERNTQFPGLEMPLSSRVYVIRTTQGNGLVISKTHTPNFFELPKEEQQEMLDVAGRVAELVGKGKDVNHEVWINYGKHGHQNGL